MNHFFDKNNVCEKSTLINKFLVDDIVDNYKQVFDIDVSLYFSGLNEIELRELPSGYRFFYPLNISGDAEFYKLLQKIDWYYQDWKWEYDIAKKMIQEGEKVLDIGCGKGVFIKAINTKNDCTGLELNDGVIQESNQLKILHETIEMHAKNNEGNYDWVFAFQVLEHINDIDSFISSSLKVLKRKGYLFIAVPNNDAIFFKNDNFENDNFEFKKTMLLNMPPHHMGRWNSKSLKNLSLFFNMTVVEVIEEPIQIWRRRLNKDILLFKHRTINNKKTFLHKLMSKFCVFFESITRENKLGDSIIIVFQKQ